MYKKEFTKLRGEEPPCSVASVMSDSLQPSGLQPARLFCPWDSPDKDFGVGHKPSSRGSSQCKDKTCASCISFFGGGFFTHWATWEAQAGHKANPISLDSERLLLNHAKTPVFLASGGEEFNPGPETRLDRSELLCNKVLLKYEGERESFWHRHQKGAERVPTC